jgi:hypothetical protein
LNYVLGHFSPVLHLCCSLVARDDGWQEARTAFDVLLKWQIVCL